MLGKLTKVKYTYKVSFLMDSLNQITKECFKMVKTIDRQVLAKSMEKFANQKPGFDLRNYGSMSSYKSDYNRYKKYADKNRAYSYWGFLELLNSLDDDQIEYAFRHSFSGRLSINNDYSLSYCTGQYFPTEFEAALNAVIETMERINK
jgi:hypothetical protein